MRYNFPSRELLEWHISVRGEGAMGQWQRKVSKARRDTTAMII